MCKIYDILLGRIRPNPVEFDGIPVEFDADRYRIRRAQRKVFAPKEKRETWSGAVQPLTQ